MNNKIKLCCCISCSAVLFKYESISAFNYTAGRHTYDVALVLCNDDYFDIRRDYIYCQSCSRYLGRKSTSNEALCEFRQDCVVPLLFLVSIFFFLFRYSCDYL